MRKGKAGSSGNYRVNDDDENASVVQCGLALVRSIRNVSARYHRINKKRQNQSESRSQWSRFVMAVRGDSRDPGPSWHVVWDGAFKVDDLDELSKNTNLLLII